jgi:hypothetical protein
MSLTPSEEDEEQDLILTRARNSNNNNKPINNCEAKSSCITCPDSERIPVEATWCISTGKRIELYCPNRNVSTIYESCEDNSDLLGFIALCALLVILSSWIVRRRKRIHEERLRSLVHGNR